MQLSFFITKQVVETSCGRAQQSLAACGAGAIEEAFLYKMSLENVNAYLFAGPDTGCLNWHIFDYTRPAAREFWANGTSRLFNDVGCQASQWDGAEFQVCQAPSDCRPVTCLLLPYAYLGCTR